MAGARILIIDDDPDFVETASISLESAGFTVASASNGNEGLAKLREEGADLIVLDVMMSSLLEGVWVSDELSRDRALSRLPVLMVSAIPHTEYLDQFPSEGPLHIDNFLTKPVTGEQLVGAVKRLVPAKA